MQSNTLNKCSYMAFLLKYRIKYICCIAFTYIIVGSCKKYQFSENFSSPVMVYESFCHEVDNNFSFFSYINLNWDSVQDVYRKRVSNSMSQKELSNVLGEMIVLLKDAHSEIDTPYGNYYYTGWYINHPSNVIPNISNYISYYSYANDTMNYGKIRNTNLGYIQIKTFGGNDSSSYTIIDKILNQLKNTTGLIIDIRLNGGGNATFGKIIAGRFTDSIRVAVKYRFRNGPNHNDFTPWINDNIIPDHYIYKKPIVILTNKLSASASEWFVCFMKMLPQVKTVGDTTCGVSGQPMFRELSNGWMLRISNSQSKLPSGKDYQYTGLYPDFPVWITKEQSQQRIDAILEKAIEILQN